MTREEFDNLKPGDIIEWRYVNEYEAPGSEILIYGVYAKGGVYRMLTILVDLSVGVWGDNLAYMPGYNLTIADSTLINECKIISKAPHD